MQSLCTLLIIDATYSVVFVCISNIPLSLHFLPTFFFLIKFLTCPRCSSRQNAYFLLPILMIPHPLTFYAYTLYNTYIFYNQHIKHNTRHFLLFLLMLHTVSINSIFASTDRYRDHDFLIIHMCFYIV